MTEGPEENHEKTSNFIVNKKQRCSAIWNAKLTILVVHNLDMPFVNSFCARMMFLKSKSWVIRSIRSWWPGVLSAKCCRVMELRV